MAKTRGEGRSISEKQQRVFTTPEAASEYKKRRAQEEADWAAKSGPVEVRRVKDD